MGIKFYCPNGHKMHVKDFLAGKKGLCPKCGIRVEIPAASVSGPPPDAQELGLPIAAANEPLPNAQPSASSKKSLRSNLAPVFGMPADEPAPDSILTETVGEEIGPGSNSVPPSAIVQDDSSSAGISEIEINMPAAATDPIKIPPGENWYVHLPTGKQLGPIASDTLREWLDQARIGVDALVWRNGWDQWQVIRDAFAQSRSPAAGAEPVNWPRLDFSESDRMAPSGLPSQQFGEWRNRRKSRFSTTASLCLLGMVVLLFALLLFVFFNRKQPAKVSSLELRCLLAPLVGQSTADLS
jgi:hypothetical protein